MYEALKRQDESHAQTARYIDELNRKIHGDLHGCDCEGGCNCKPDLWYQLEAIKYHALGSTCDCEETLNKFKPIFENTPPQGKEGV